jgi:chemotaxis family two-component system response regulator Rcp1
MANFKALEILLVDDNPADARMTAEGLQLARSTARLSVAGDGMKAVQFLRRQGEFAAAPRPDLILLDLRLPKRSGFDVLEEVKGDPSLASIPVVVQSSSAAGVDINRAYRMHANSYITKPNDLDEFSRTMRVLVDFWLTTAKLPHKEPNGEDHA